MTTTNPVPAVAETAHTPTPWHALNTCPFANPQPDFCAVVDECHDVLAKLNPRTPKSIREANAAFIVRAANHFQPLLSLVDQIAGMTKYGAYTFPDDAVDTMNSLIERARAILASIGS